MADDSIEFSFVTQLAQMLLNYAKDIVVKREDLAKKYETVDTIRDFDYYMAAKTQTDSFETYGEFPDFILQQAGLSEEEIRLAKLNKQNIPVSKREAVVLAYRQYILENFEERNDYYRMLMGLPSINDHMQIYITDSIPGVDNSKPIHMMTNDEISILNSLGYIDKLIQEHPKRPYLKFLGDKKIDLIFARNAKKFDILRTGTLENEKLKSRFELNYLLARNYIMNVFYIKSLSLDQEYYDAYIGFVILLYALMMTVNESIEIYNAKEFSNEIIIKQLLQSYNLDIFDDIPINYRKRIADNIESLIVSKSTDEVIFKIFQLFGVEDITIKKFMIVKDHKKDENERYVYSYNFDGFSLSDGPNEIPDGNVNTCSWSPNDGYLAVGIDAFPYIHIYKKNGELIKLQNPQILPTGKVWGCAWKPDSNYLCVVHENYPFITIYKRNGDNFTKIPNPEELPSGNAYSVSWSKDGNYLAVGHSGYPFVTAYEVSGETLTKLPNPNDLPTDESRAVSWSSDSIYLAVGYNQDPYILVYKRDGNVLTKINEPSLTVPDSVTSCAWTPDGLNLVVCHYSNPYFTVFKRNNDNFSKFPTPSELPTGSCLTCTWSSNGRYLVVGYQTHPYLSVYKKVDEDLMKLTDTVNPPAGTVYDVSLTFNGKQLVVAHNSYPYISIYNSDNYEIDYNDMYDISFAAIDIRSSNIDAEIRKPENKLAYTEITSKDIYWGGYESDEAIRQKLLRQEFNYIDTDYISIDSAYSLSNIVTEMSYFFSMVFTLKPYLKKLTFIEPLFGHTVDVFYALVMVTALSSKKIGYAGNIITDPANIAEVYKFNFDRSLVEINNIMNKYKYKGNANDYLIGVPSTEITDPKVLSSLYFYNMDIHDKILNLKSTTRNLNEYLALREISSYILRSKLVSDIFRKSNGEVASTYLDYLKDGNIIIGNYIESVPLNEVDSVMFKILSSLEEYFNEERFRFIFLKTPNVSGDDSIKKYMRKVINTFKAFTINILSITVTYELANKNTNNVKILDSCSFTVDQFKINNITMVDSIGLYGEKNGRVNIRLKDELELIK